MKKSTASRGILTELESMVQNNNFSQPIHSVFGLKNKTEPLKIKGEFMVPITLSESQQAVFHSVFKNELTLVVGPPGTGKSFTIAALAVEMLTRGMSVLIASKNDQAVNVIANKIERDFGLAQVVVNAANKDYKKALQARLKDLLSGMIPASNPLKIKKLQEKLGKISQDIKDLEEVAELRSQIEREEGRTLYDDQRGLLQLNDRARRFAQFLKMEETRFFEKYFPIESIQKRLRNWSKSRLPTISIGVWGNIAFRFNNYSRHFALAQATKRKVFLRILALEKCWIRSLFGRSIRQKFTPFCPYERKCLT